MTPCVEWTGACTPKGYGRLRIRGQQMYVHRWIWEDANGLIPKGMVIMHICDNPPCYALDHLRLGTYAENSGDMVTKGRQARGARLPHTKLTDDQVREIYASTEPGVALASKYGVDKSMITMIRKGQRRSRATQKVSI